MPDAKPKFAAPPINEVVCGFLFDAVPDLDILKLGLFWDRNRERYPKRKIQPPLADQPGIVIGPDTSVRAWIISPDDSLLLQLQHDRFYMNWRKRNEEYPRFSDDGGRHGLLHLALEEFEGFKHFVKETCEVDVVPNRIELSKIDLLLEGETWKGFPDLVKLIPCLKPCLDFAKSEHPRVSLGFAEETKELGSLQVQLQSAFAAQKTAEGPAEAKRVLRIQSQLVRALSEGEALLDAFRASNDRLNEVFFNIISPDELERFEPAKE